MASKIRLIPTVGIDLLTFFRQQEINWTETRPIDVIYAGWVDYPAPYHFHEATRVLASRHRRAAIQQLARLRGLRVLIGMNQALSADIYKTTMMRSLISVSPWGLGEYAYRDYESILAGCVMVKPLTDHVLTFPPDIYQSGNHYIRCNPDFTDLARTIESILDDQGHAIELARRAREAMLRENAPEKIHAYYLNLFREALA